VLRVPQRGSWATAVLLAACVALASGARAAQNVQLYAGFSPDRPNVSSTITFGFTIKSPGGGIPSPLESIDLHLPAGIGLARNTLGTAICEPVYLFAHGPNGCPPNSRVGHGTALAEVPYGPLSVQEEASIDAYRGSSSEGSQVTLLFFAEGTTPVFADLVFPGQLLADSSPYSGRINTVLPLVPSLPGGPNVSLARFQSTFGPQGLVYEREVSEERFERFTPRGVTVPRVCPPSGYPFAGDFSFEDGSHVTAYSAAPCPHRQLKKTRPR
jgi:hypothetical protein